MTLPVPANLRRNAGDWRVPTALNGRHAIRRCPDETGEEVGEEGPERWKRCADDTAVRFNAGPVAGSDISPCGSEKMMRQLK